MSRANWEFQNLPFRNIFPVLKHDLARSLNRTKRHVSPTEIGLAYYDRARRVLNHAGEADAVVSSMQSAPTGMLRVSVATDFGSMHLSQVLGDFLAQFPDVSVNLELDNR